MNNKLVLLFLLFFGLSNVHSNAQCAKAEAYVAKVKAAENWSPTERVKSGSKVQGWTQLGTWHAYKCECDKGGRTTEQAENLKNGLNEIRQTIVNLYSDTGEIPPVVTKCKSGTNSNTSNNLSNYKSSFQVEMENRFNNYNKAMSLKAQGENIAKAFAEQVKQYGNLNAASDPSDLLNNFNQNMSQIAQLQSQNRVDNLNQIDATIGSALNDLNSGNAEGALFSALSLIDQSYEQKQAKKEAEYQKQKLVQQHKQQMSQFYWKAVDLNNNAINSYYKNAAYAFSVQDEQYYLDFVAHHECFKNYMKNNFSFSNTNWTINHCEVPDKKEAIKNNLTAKDVQYKNTANRKYHLYEETGVDEFKQAAIRFAGMAVNENQSTENYYLLGHYAGIEEPITAFIAFHSIKEIDPNYFNSDKQGEYFLIENAIESTFKDAIKENNLDFIKNAILADLHKVILFEDNSALLYAIKVDQPDVVQLFLNDLTKGKTQQQITNKVNDVILMASTLDAAKTIKRFIDLGFFINFKIDDKSPIDVAVESVSLNSIRVLLNASNKKESYISLIKTQNPDILTYFELIDKGGFSKFSDIKTGKMKSQIIRDLYHQRDKTNFFRLIEINPEAIDITKKDIGSQNIKIDFYTDWKSDRIINNGKPLFNISKYIEFNLVPIETIYITGEDRKDFLKIVKKISYAVNIDKEEGTENLINHSMSYNFNLDLVYWLIKQTPDENLDFNRRVMMPENATLLINEIAAQKKKISSEVWFGCVWGIKKCKTTEDYIERKKAIDSIIKLSLCPEKPLDFKFNLLHYEANDDIKKMIKEDKRYWSSIIEGNFENRNK